MGNTISSRPEDGDPLKVWDVSILWDLAKDLPVRSVPIESLGELDRVAWYGADQHSGRLTVRQFVRHAERIDGADLDQPILLSSEGKMLDGFHRIAKAFRLGVTHLPAKQFIVDPPPVREVSMPDYIRQTYFGECGEISIDPVRVMKFNLATARESASAGRIEEWVQAYLSGGDWRNPGLAEGLKRHPRHWAGPVEMDLDVLLRTCGPEADLPYRVDAASWEDRVTAISDRLDAVRELPPLLVEYQHGVLYVRDGNHRHEALRRRGLARCWVIVWYKFESDRTRHQATRSTTG